MGSSNKLVVVNYIDIQVAVPRQEFPGLMLSCLGTATTMYMYMYKYNVYMYECTCMNYTYMYTCF